MLLITKFAGLGKSQTLQVAALADFGPLQTLEIIAFAGLKLQCLLVLEYF